MTTTRTWSRELECKKRRKYIKRRWSSRRKEKTRRLRSSCRIKVILFTNSNYRIWVGSLGLMSNRTIFWKTTLISIWRNWKRNSLNLRRRKQLNLKRLRRNTKRSFKKRERKWKLFKIHKINTLLKGKSRKKWSLILKTQRRSLRDNISKIFKI